MTYENVLKTSKPICVQKRDIYLDGGETPKIYYFEELKAQPVELWDLKQVEATWELCLLGHRD